MPSPFEPVEFNEPGAQLVYWTKDTGPHAFQMTHEGTGQGIYAMYFVSKPNAEAWFRWMADQIRDA